MGFVRNRQNISAVTLRPSNAVRGRYAKGLWDYFNALALLQENLKLFYLKTFLSHVGAAVKAVKAFYGISLTGLRN